MPSTVAPRIGPKKALRHYIKEHLDSHGMTQKDLAGRLGCDPMTVSRWVRYEIKVTPDTLAAIAEVLWRDPERWEDLLHHPDRPGPNQLLRMLPSDDQAYIIRTMKSLLGSR